MVKIKIFLEINLLQGMKFCIFQSLVGLGFRPPAAGSRPSVCKVSAPWL